MRRLFYSPEVFVYIKTSTGKVIDLSNDVIDGEITRRTEALSTLRLNVQNRRDNNEGSYLAQKILPMDRIIVYLKKVKPVLVFSGYLDLVPFIQAVPGPVEIEASCTLKRLEYTYWDPNLPFAFEMFAKFGFAMQDNGQGGLTPFLVPNQVATARGAKKTSGNIIQDTGFGAMLYFLLHEVGHWPKEKIWIEPIPDGWTERAVLLWKEAYEENKFTEELAKNFIEAVVGAKSSTAGGAATSGASGITGSIDPELAGKIDTYLAAKKSPLTTFGKDFVEQGVKNKVDPRLMVAIAGAETSFATDNNAGRDITTGHNAWGMGPHKQYPSWPAGIQAVAENLGGNLYLGSGLTTISKIQPRWAPNGASNDPTNLNSNWKTTVSKFFQELGGDPSAQVVGITFGDALDQTRTRKSDTPEAEAVAKAASAASTEVGKVNNAALSVYIEAGHSPADDSSKRQPGYEKQTGASIKDGLSEVQANINFVPKIKEKIDKGHGTDGIVSSEAHVDTSRPGGWVGDIYISIHHDPSFTGTSFRIGYPTQDSVANATNNNGNVVENAGSGEPNHYDKDTGGVGWVKPGKTAGGRLNINKNKGLQANSQVLANYVKESLASAGYTAVQDNSSNRMNNYYGFYYSNAKACLIIECPSVKGSGISYDIDKAATAIAAGIEKYRLIYKKPGNQQDVGEGFTVGGGSGSSGGDNSTASQVIRACLRTIKNAGARIAYSSPGKRNTPLIECEQKLYDMDCSGFISNALTEVVGRAISQDTQTMYDQKQSEVENTLDNLVPGMLLVNPPTGPAGHVGIYCGNGIVAECTSHNDSQLGDGPQTSNYKGRWDVSKYKAIVHPLIGTTEDPPTMDQVGSDTASTLDAMFATAKNVAFNIQFNFPGSLLESVLLTGQRSLENDVKLLETVAEVCKSSFRTFASTPEGDFIAWYPDYFNISGRNPRWVISRSELIKCTINLSDKNLATHVYVIGSPYSIPGESTPGELNWLQKLTNQGVVTLERGWILDTFLRKFQKNTNPSTNPNAKITDARTRPILEGQGAALKFLEKYGARPYMEKPLTIRHPIFEFFYAYHTFIQKWAEQFISEVQFTFMPELLPGFIIELEHLNVTFYVKEVTHSFSYESGFFTNAILVAPGTTKESRRNYGMVLVTGPKGLDDDFTKTRKATIKPKRPATGKKTKKIPSVTQRPFL